MERNAEGAKCIYTTLYDFNYIKCATNLHPHSSYDPALVPGPSLWETASNHLRVCAGNL